MNILKKESRHIKKINFELLERQNDLHNNNVQDQLSLFISNQKALYRDVYTIEVGDNIYNYLKKDRCLNILVIMMMMVDVVLDLVEAGGMDAAWQVCQRVAPGSGGVGGRSANVGRWRVLA